jgi:hypothetical protein
MYTAQWVYKVVCVCVLSPFCLSTITRQNFKIKSIGVKSPLPVHNLANSGTMCIPCFFVLSTLLGSFCQSQGVTLHGARPFHRIAFQWDLFILFILFAKGWGLNPGPHACWASLYSLSYAPQSFVFAFETGFHYFFAGLTLNSWSSYLHLQGLLTWTTMPSSRGLFWPAC